MIHASEIIDRVDIVEVISRSLKLKPTSGLRYLANCPFHSEKTPSFTVFKTSQSYHCFGCKASGNVISWVKFAYNLNYVEALTYLAEGAGLNFQPPKKKFSNPLESNPASIKPQNFFQKEEKLPKARTGLQEIIGTAVKNYQQQLKNSSKASSYLTRRNLAEEIIDKFQLGYSSSEFSVVAHFKPEHFEALQLCGLAGANHKDRLKGRIIFPIRNLRGEYVGFAGRVVEEDQKLPKYLNSQESSLFNKREQLYGFFESAKSIRKFGYSIVVEGYFDVISLHQAGFTNTVGVMGTSLNEYQLRKLFQFAPKVNFCFDSDEAGLLAAKKALEISLMFLNDQNSIYFTFIPPQLAKDPDSLIQNQGKSSFEKLLASSSPASEMLLQECLQPFSTDSLENRSAVITKFKNYWQQLTNSSFKDMLLESLAQKLQLEPLKLCSWLEGKNPYSLASNSSFRPNVRFQNYQNSYQILPSIRQAKDPKAAVEDQMNPTFLTQTKQKSLLAQTALQNINWVLRYSLPEELPRMNRFQKELLQLLDYIQCSFNARDKANLEIVQQELDLQLLELEAELKGDVVDFDFTKHYQAFAACLDDFFRKKPEVGQLSLPSSSKA